MPLTVFDLHNHLEEKKLDPNEWWQAAQAKDINVIAITEHVEYGPESSFKQLAQIRPKNIVLIPGMELNTTIGHVIALGETEKIYGLDELLEPGIPIDHAIEIADSNKILLSIAHPWGFRYDSAFHYVGDRGVTALINCYPQLGVEAYNGMIGHVSFLAFDSNWTSKPRNWIEYLETSRIARTTRVSRLGKKIRKSFDKKIVDIIEKSGKAMELGEKAQFVTAGSDAHFIEQIGTGIMKMKTKNIPTTPREALSLIKKNKQNIIWIGPYTREKENGTIEIERISITKKHILDAMSYATKDFILRKTHTKERIAKLTAKLKNRKKAKK